MKSLLVKLVAGVLLFAGSLVGALAATGRLNHEGTANIPVLGSFFPAPPASEGDGEHGTGDKTSSAADAVHTGGGITPVDATQGPGTQDPEKQGEPTGPVKSKTGRSVLKPEEAPKTDGHGGAAEGGHGGGESGHEAAGGHGDKNEKKEAAHKPEAPSRGAATEDPAGDMARLEKSLSSDPKSKYAPGGYFRFDGMPADLTPDQINEAWQRVQGVLAEIDKRRTALDLREQELQELADDISRRQHELGRERTKIEERHRELDARMQKFQDQVKLVRNDEVAALKRNAETLASFEADKAAQLVMDQWKTERGQDEVLRTFEFMDKDAVNTILNALPNPMVQDVLKKRLRVSREAVPTAPSK